MSIATLAYEHLDCSDAGRPLIAGKNFKVIHLIQEHTAYGWSAEELAFNHPQLTLGEIYSGSPITRIIGSRWIANWPPARREPDKCTVNPGIA